MIHFGAIRVQLLQGKTFSQPMKSELTEGKGGGEHEYNTLDFLNNDTLMIAGVNTVHVPGGNAQAALENHERNLVLLTTISYLLKHVYQLKGTDFKAQII